MLYENCILSYTYCFIEFMLSFVVDLGYSLRNCGSVFFKMMMKHSLYGVMRYGRPFILIYNNLFAMFLLLYTSQHEVLTLYINLIFLKYMS
jgi:hypothetical protein